VWEINADMIVKAVTINNREAEAGHFTR
jgi:hypothetical protein